MQFSEDVHRIIDAGIRAPSGDNTQPWSFRVTGQRIDILAYPERDNPIYNFHERGTRIAIGALVENMAQAARAMGYDTVIQFFIPSTSSRIVATIVCKQTDTRQNIDALAYIQKRSTNRRLYDGTPLTDDEKKIINQAGTETGVRLHLIEDRSVQRVIAKAVSVNEWILLRNKSLHSSFFPHVVWTEAEEREKKTGLYFKTLELKPHEGVIFRLFQYWFIARIFQLLGFPTIIAKSNAMNYASGSAIGMIIVPVGEERFYTAGRVLERVWLASTAMNVALQPITAISFMVAHVRSGESTVFHPEEIQAIERAYTTIQTHAGLHTGEEIAMIFRIGHAAPPSATVSRIAPHIEFMSS